MHPSEPSGGAFVVDPVGRVGLPDEVGPHTPVVRFTRAIRWLHWTNAALFAVMLATAAALYLGPLSTLVGRRELMKTVHVWAGLALPVPLLLSLVGPWRRQVLPDLRRLARWDDLDVARAATWAGRVPLVRRVVRSRAVPPSGKFHPGQKVNASFTLGAILAMLVSGLIMWQFEPFPLSWRTGATFVHDWLALILVITIAGHLVMAGRDPEARRGMRRGVVARSWAQLHHPRWQPEDPPGGSTG